jgi:hypothetical protein
MMKITKTTPQMKLPEDIINEMNEIEDHTLEMPLLSLKEQIAESEATRIKTETSKE